MKELPKFNDWTIDTRLKQFRRATEGKQEIEFVDFNSDEGKTIIKEYLQEQYNYYTEYAENAQRNIIDIENDNLDDDAYDEIISEMIGE